MLSISSSSLLADLTEGVLLTPNVDHLVKLQKDNVFYDCYKKTKWVICDSRVLFICMKLCGCGVKEYISGSTFFTHFYEYHKNDLNCKIFLLGALNNVANVAKEKINKKIGRCLIVDALSPSFGFENNIYEIDGIINAVNASSANVVVVGMGAPKQEKFIFQYKHRMPNVKIWMALGATIDFEAGNKKRAPKWMQYLALEWFYRLLCEPRRLFKRYLIDDPKLFWYMLKQAFGLYKNPFGK